MLTKKRILPVLLSFLMVFTMMPLTAGKAYALDYYGLWIGSTQLTSDNAADFMGGKVKFEPASGETPATLTLDDATIDEDPNAISTDIPVLKIELRGENKLTARVSTIVNMSTSGEGEITITGTGNLRTEGSAGAIDARNIKIDSTTVTAIATKYTYGYYGSIDGIHSSNDITISGSTVTATSENDYGVNASGGEVKIEGLSTLHAEGVTGAIHADDGISIGDGLVITKPANGRISDDGKDIVDQNGNIAKSVTIEPLVQYGLWVGGEQVTSINKGDIFRDGTASYDADNNILTLNNATITGVYLNMNIHSTIPDLTIEVKGENKLSGGSAGIESSQSFTITGSGSLKAEGSSYGIMPSQDVTIIDVTVTATGTVVGGINAYGEVKIKGSSKVYAKGPYYAIYGNSGISIGDGLGITEPANGRITDDGKYTADQNGQVATSATIEPVYAITLAKTANGKASLSAEKAGEGAKVTVTATPDEGYVLDKTTYTDKDGKTTAIPASGEFTMPASDITVNVTFKKQNVKPEPTEPTEPTTKPTTEPTTKPAPVAKVSGTLLARMTAKGKKNLVLSWNKVSGAQGYDVFFVKCSRDNTCRLACTIEGNKTFKWTKKRLKKKTAYKAYVKAWVMKDGKKSYVRTSPTVHAYTSGSTKNYTNVKNVTVKKSEVSLKKGSTYQIRAKVKKLRKDRKLMKKGHGPKLRYLSSNTKVATVSSSGKIRGKAEGKCKVYVYAINGVSKTIKVTVK